MTATQEIHKEFEKSKKDYRSRIRALKHLNDKQNGNIEQLQDSVRETEERAVELEQLQLEAANDVPIMEKRIAEMRMHVGQLELRNHKQFESKDDEARTKDEKIAQAQREVKALRQELNAQIESNTILETELKDEKIRLPLLQRTWLTKLSEAEEGYNTLEGELRESRAKLEETATLVQERASEKRGIQQEIAQIQEIRSTLEAERNKLRGRLTQAEKMLGHDSETITKAESDLSKSRERHASLVSELAQAKHELEVENSKVVQQRHSRLSTNRASIARLHEILLPMKRSLSSILTTKQVFEECNAQSENKLDSMETELASKKEKIAELTKVAHDSSMALIKYKNSCTDAHLKLDAVVKERDELSKLMESMNTTEDEKVALTDKIVRAEKELKDAREREAEIDCKLGTVSKERDRLACVMSKSKRQLGEAAMAKKEQEKLAKTVTKLRQELKVVRNAKNAALRKCNTARTQSGRKQSTGSARIEAEAEKGRTKHVKGQEKHARKSSLKRSVSSIMKSSTEIPNSAMVTRSRSGALSSENKENRTKGAKRKENDSPSGKSSSSDNSDLFCEEDLYGNVSSR